MRMRNWSDILETEDLTVSKVTIIQTINYNLLSPDANPSRNSAAALVRRTTLAMLLVVGYNLNTNP